ncbi:TraG family protein, partial [human gut metagenome]
RDCRGQRAGQAGDRPLREDSQIIDFTDKDGNDTMQQQIDANYYRIKNEVRQIVADEIGRIKADPELSHLIKDK